MARKFNWDSAAYFSRMASRGHERNALLPGGEPLPDKPKKPKKRKKTALQMALSRNPKQDALKTSEKLAKVYETLVVERRKKKPIKKP